MNKRFFQICSFFLCIALLVGMLPMRIFAEALQTETANTNAATASTQAETTPVQSDAVVVGEIVENRTEYSKEFRLDNGLVVAAVYTQPVHYQQEGQWKDIDNTLATASDGTLTNTAGVWDVSFPQQLSKSNPVTITKDGHTLSFVMSGELRNQGDLEVMSSEGDVSAAAAEKESPAEKDEATSQKIDSETTLETASITVDGAIQTFAVSSAKVSTGSVQKIDLSEAKAAAQYEELIAEKNTSQLMYANVYSNTDVQYDLQGNKVKESIILNSYDSALRGYRYTLNVGDMIPVLCSDGGIEFYDAGKENLVMYMPAPYLVDDAKKHNYDIQVNLTGGNGVYTLSYILPSSWLASADREWPVVLDPVITTNPDVINTRDHTIASNGSYSYLRSVLECGYGPSYHKHWFFIKYRTLPTLKSSDVIIGATMSLYKPEDASLQVPVNVHKVLGTWESETLTWANKPGYDTTIEDYALVTGSGWYHWDVTDIARGWYSGANTGMMFKAADAYEDGSNTNTWKQFASADNGAASWLPSLTLVYRNNNGLESYWDYTSASAGRAGTGYVNSYTGNLVLVRDDIGFGGNRMPVSISHVYNLNDSTNNEFGVGSGWRTNFNQQVYVWSQNSSYYVWEDSDGTDHYFKADGAGNYKDEDGLELTLTVSDTTKTITDKYGNKSYFDSSGRLYKQENNQATKSSINIVYSSGLQIDYITDGAGRKYDFNYVNGLLSSIQYLGAGTDPLATTTFTYSGTNLIQIKDTDNKASTYTYSGNILTSAKDIDGYELRYAYNAPTSSYQPYRVKTVSEYDGSSSGGVLNIEYAHNQTTMTDYQGNKQILQFNNFGNTVCTQDDEGHAQYAKYAINNTDETGKANQLSLSSRMQNTVANLLSDTSFENGTIWHPSGIYETDNEISTSVSYHGNKSLCIVSTSGAASGRISMPAGATYTFSAYVKTENRSANLMLGGVTSATLPANQDWTRLEVSFTNPVSYAMDMMAFVQVQGGSGNVYVDCVQLEQAPTASRYNLIQNGDFTNGTTGWEKTYLNTSDGVVTAPSAAASMLNTAAMKITGSPTNYKRLFQRIYVNGTAGDTFVASGWAIGNAAPQNGYDTRGRDFALHIQFRYTDGSTQTEAVARFNMDSDQWQYASTPVVAKKDYTQVIVHLLYDYNVNYVMFDGIQLYKEEFGNSYTYDANGNVTSVKDLQKQTTTYEYTNNNLTKQTLPTGAKLTYEYDNHHNVTKATTETGQVYEFAYDTYGNNTSVSIVSGSSKITSTAAYSSDGNRLLSTTDALGNVTTYDYDANTNVLKSVKYPEDTDATKTNYTYDSMYRVASAAATTDTGLAMSASYTYANDLLTKIQTPSTVYSFTYGNFANRTNVKAGSRNLATYTYADRTHYLTQLDYGNEDKVQYTYDKKGRVTSQTYEDGSTVTYTYDNNGALATVKDSETYITTTYYYDFTDRMMKYVEGGPGYSHSVAYTYDNINNLTALVETINGTKYTTSYAYDADNRITSITGGSAVKSYTYDAFGRSNVQTTKNGSATVKTDTFTFNNPSGTTTSTQIATHNVASTGLTKTFSYTYDKNGNILTVSDGTNTTSYVYDSANQLVRENNQAGNFTHTWTYDKSGNILERKEYAYTTGTLGTPTDTVSYTYGDTQGWGDLLTAYDGQTITYDTIGNPLSDGTWTYTWKHGRQLASMTDGTTTWNYTYNADGLRTKKTDGTTTYSYVYNGSQLSQMKVGSNTLYFSYDASGVPMSVTYGNATYYYITNVQGDVTGILNSDGALVVSYTYDAWGNQLSCTGDDAATLGTYNPLRYRGYVYDQGTGLYYLQSRYYDPEIGRFINADSLIDNRGFITQNVFQYCGNNPVNNADSSGNLFGAIVGIGLLVIGMVAILSGCSSKPAATTSTPSTPSKPSAPSSSTSPTTPPHIPTPQEKSYAATVYAEAGGQNKRSKQAVAHVMNNRVGTRSSWPDIESVISAKYQFDGYNSPMYQAAMNYYNNGICNNSIEQAAMDECLAVVIPIYSGEEADITGGALYFHSFSNPSDWAYHNSYTQVYVSGTEKFWFYK